MQANKTTDINNNSIVVDRSSKMQPIVSSKSAALINNSSCKSEKWLKKLQRERDELMKQVSNLASYNYAREPDFVRDRSKLRETLEEVNHLKRSIQSRYCNRILSQLETTQEKIDQEARNFEEKSERMAKDFLDGNIKHGDFLERYINIRKIAIQKRILADKLVKERGRLDVDLTSTSASGAGKNKNKTIDQQNSPTPTPRQRKRASFVTSVVK